MARKVITTTETEEDEDKRNKTPEEEDEDVLRALIEIEGTDEIRWQIYRVSQPDPGFLQTLNTAELSMDRMAEFGPGRYKVRGIKQDGSYYKGRTLTISKRPQANPNQLVNEAIEKFKGKDMDTMAFMQLLMNQQQESSRSMTQVLVAAMQRPEAKSFDWGPVIAALPASLTALKEFFANRSDPMKQMLDAIAVTEKLRGESDSKGTSWPDLVKEGLSNLPAALQTLRPTSQPPVPGQAYAPPAHSLAAPVETPEAVPPPDSNMNFQLLSWLRDMLAQMLKGAQRNGNVTLYAELFLDQLPDSISDEQVLQLLGVPEWWQRLTLFDAQLKPYQQWFTELRDAVILLLQSDETEETEESHDDRRHAQSDAHRARASRNADQGTVRPTPEGDAPDAG